MSRVGKYNARKVKLDGYTFDSKIEARRYGELKLLEKAGEVWDIEVHPRFPIFLKGKKICDVVLDFVYCCEKKLIAYEDVKGYQTSESKLRIKLVEAYNGIKVDLIRYGRR